MKDNKLNGWMQALASAFSPNPSEMTVTGTFFKGIKPQGQRMGKETMATKCWKQKSKWASGN